MYAIQTDHARAFACSVNARQPPKAEMLRAKPELLRVTAGGGTAIDIEIWAMPLNEFGQRLRHVGGAML